MDGISRRRTLRLATLAGSLGLAGCLSSGSDDESGNGDDPNVDDVIALSEHATLSWFDAGTSAGRLEQELAVEQPLEVAVE